MAHAKLLVGRKLHRINTTAKEGEYALDDARPEKVNQLVVLGRGEAAKKDNDDVVRERFLNRKPAAPFVPIHPVEP